MPWCELLALITPHAPVAKTGRPPFDLAMMLRVHCLQQWFGLSDLGAEEALFETSSRSGVSRLLRREGKAKLSYLQPTEPGQDKPKKALRTMNQALCMLTSSTCRRCLTRAVGAICSWPLTGPHAGCLCKSTRISQTSAVWISCAASPKPLLSKSPSF